MLDPHTIFAKINWTRFTSSSPTHLLTGTLEALGCDAGHGFLQTYPVNSVLNPTSACWWESYVKECFCPTTLK
jgi:hypothetical protein